MADAGRSCATATANSDGEPLDAYDYDYDCVHPSIHKVLTMEPRGISVDFLELAGLVAETDDNPILVDTKSCTIRWNLLDAFLEHSEISKVQQSGPQHTTITSTITSTIASTIASTSTSTTSQLSTEQLVYLASQSELALMKIKDGEMQMHGGGGDSLLPPPIRGLLQILPEKHRHRSGEKHCGENKESGGERCLIATLLALNTVENSIRHLLGKTNGRAPLLKDMIDSVAARGEGDDTNANAAPPKSLPAVLRALLLPKHGGLNLRNLLWHGFLPTIHPRWLALSVVLALSLDELAGSSSFGVLDGCVVPGTNNTNNLQNLSAMRKHPQLAAILDHGRATLSSREAMAAFERKIVRSKIVPGSHLELFRVSLKFVDFPVLFASVAGPLIEHLLRLMWCDENKQHKRKRIAEPGSYYVTLDGHGQRDKHEVVILPFFSRPQQQGTTSATATTTTTTHKNRLVHRLGGPRMAFLMDLFAAPSGAPNIRASVAHGAFNKYLFEELAAIEGDKKDGTGTTSASVGADELKDMTSALLSVLDALCGDVPACCPGDTNGPEANTNAPIGLYRPCFSYSATLLAELDSMVNEMKPFYKFIRDGHYLKHVGNASKSRMQEDVAHKVADMSQSIETIVGMQESIYRSFGRNKSNSRFTDDDFFRESTNNSRASECGAAQLLLSEISRAASSSLRDLNDGIAMLRRDDNVQVSSRRRKQIYRICSSAKLTLDFYSFAAFCALLYIDRRREGGVTVSTRCAGLHTPRMSETLTDDDFFVAVKRSRMAVSTFSTTKTFNRALDALAQYTAGKAVKAISKSVREESSI